MITTEDSGNFRKKQRQASCQLIVARNTVSRVCNDTNKATFSTLMKRIKFKKIVAVASEHFQTMKSWAIPI